MGQERYGMLAWCQRDCNTELMSQVHDPHGAVLHESMAWTSSGQFVFTTISIHQVCNEMLQLQNREQEMREISGELFFSLG